MARVGGFGGSLNPFGSGSLGSLGQYDIGADLADLEVYKVEVAWGNGLATDEAYLAALTKAVNATDPGTQKRESATNKYDDAVYRIGRSVAEAAGLDQLIAFDMAALAKMNPSNVRYRDVEDSLQSEKASRRSRDYGKLVNAYNEGKSTTQSLLAWVNTQLGGITSDDPDFDSWNQVQGDLEDRIVSEKDSEVYQDYQQGRMKAPAFLAYLTTRRNSYLVGSPQYEDWTRKLEDAQKQVTDNAQSAKDSAFFNRYQEGKVSDATYLKYLKDRIATMKPDDPSLGEWKHRLVEATFSLAEDKLRFDVGRGKAPVSRLISFYKSYQRTLNPGSAEWRSVQRNLDSLGASGGRSSGGGGGRSSGGSSGGSSTGSKSAGAAIGGKVIMGGKYTLDTVMGTFAIDPTANKSAIAAAKKYLDNNKQSLYNALQNDDKVWLFTDPRNPTATVAELDPQGNPTGRTIRGAAYLPVTSEAYSNILLTEAGNWNMASEYALSQHRYGDAALYSKRSAEALDNARKNDAGYRAQNIGEWTDNMVKIADQATKAGDYGLAARTLAIIGTTVYGQLQNPYLTDEARNKINGIGEDIAKNPLAGVDPNTGLERALNMTSLQGGEVVLNPGWHHVLSSKGGQPTWGPEFDERQDGTWEMEHVQVATAFGDRIVKGEVRKSTAPITPIATVYTPTGQQKIAGGPNADFLSYVDERGQVVRAYSLDGTTWISPAAGQPAPEIEITEPVQLSLDGTSYLLVSDPSKVVLTQNGSGGWEPTQEANGRIGWYGQAAYDAAKSRLKDSARGLGRTQTTVEEGRVAETVYESRGRLANHEQARVDFVNGMDVGGPGQHMMLTTTGPMLKDNQGRDIPSDRGTINLVPQSFYRTDYGSGKDDAYSRLPKPAKKPLAGADLFPSVGAFLAPKSGYGRSEADVARAREQADPGDRYDGYELSRGTYTVPRLVPKQSAPSFAGGAKNPIATPPALRPVSDPKETAPAKKVVPPLIKPATKTAIKGGVATKTTAAPKPTTNSPYATAPKPKPRPSTGGGSGSKAL